jgi:hypothetical protein
MAYAGSNNVLLVATGMNNKMTGLNGATGATVWT